MQVIDRGGQPLNFEDVSHVQKFEISDTEYAKRTGMYIFFKFLPYRV
jgi:hypothetical protein